MRDVRELEQRYRDLEGRTEVTLETKVRRGQVGLLLALILSVLLAGSTAAVDLRRLRSPAGTARAWAEATVFGDCDRHLHLSVPAPGAVRRSRAELCAALQARSAVARTRLPSPTVRTRLLSQDGRRAVARAAVSSPQGTTTTQLPLRRLAGRWVVVRDDDACRLGCG
ncbi:MAG: hypothetical protein JWO60_3252 [Frankiales bacterium]|nr:hypothetical protein [Frankiales bacterium]